MQFKSIIENLFYAATLTAASALSASPIQAATLAYSQGEFQLEFRQNSSNFVTSTTTNTLAIASSDTSTAMAEAFASANFLNEPLLSLCPSESLSNTAVACNSTLSFSMGVGDSYLGIAESTSQILGSFSLAANETFAFDFFGFLGLLAATNNPDEERAIAQGEILLELYDYNYDRRSLSKIDFFTASSFVDTSGQDFVSFQGSQSLTYSTEVLENQELVLAFVEGTYSRRFDQPIELILIETKFNQTEVKTKVPESFRSLTLIFLGVAAFQITAKKLAR